MSRPAGFWYAYMNPPMIRINTPLTMDGPQMLCLIPAATPIQNPIRNRNPNPNWMKQDRHLLSWIQATLTEGVLAQVVGLQTSRDVWVALERRYASLSRAHISQLTTQLQTIKKGGMTITDYMNKIKAISDNLAAVGKSIHDDDLIHHIVHGLPPEYDPIRVSIRTNPSISTVEEVHAILASEELLLEERRQLQSSITHESTAFIAQNNSFQNNLGSNYGRGRNTNNGRGRGRGRGGYGRGGGQPPRNNNTNANGGQRPTCQICNRIGHIALDCHHRMDLHIKGVLLLSAFKQWWQQLLPPLIKLGMLILEPPTT
uniref:CCHC-type domain-containing protein n=1 Tax=Ananas comosus var. bracteatus TaxID=296719 RepID=A0A6V7QAH9_ANACO|nr:unnamed protein product [Ananas comosus var. bracteatus]